MGLPCHTSDQRGATLGDAELLVKQLSPEGRCANQFPVAAKLTFGKPLATTREAFSLIGAREPLADRHCRSRRDRH